jgi:DEAD/DEAH box helicase domain-containing protein
MARVVFDLELGRGFGYGLADKNITGFALAVTWDDVDGFVHWRGPQGRALIDYLLARDEIVGFNLLGYDHPVLSGYLLPSEPRLLDELKRKTVDLHKLLLDIMRQRYSLATVARATLGEGKLTPPEDDEDDEALAAYCERDVELTRDLDDYRRAYGLLYVVPLTGVHLTGWEPSSNRPSWREGRR